MRIILTASLLTFIGCMGLVIILVVLGLIFYIGQWVIEEFIKFQEGRVQLLQSQKYCEEKRRDCMKGRYLGLYDNRTFGWDEYARKLE